MKQITISVDSNAIGQLVDTANLAISDMEASGDFDEGDHDFLINCVEQVEAAIANAKAVPSV